MFLNYYLEIGYQWNTVCNLSLYLLRSYSYIILKRLFQKILNHSHLTKIIHSLKTHQPSDDKYKFILKVKRRCTVNFIYRLTLKNKGRSWSCSVTAVEKDLPALAISHFNTIWKWTCRISLCYPVRDHKAEYCNIRHPLWQLFNVNKEIVHTTS